MVQIPNFWNRNTENMSEDFTFMYVYNFSEQEKVKN